LKACSCGSGAWSGLKEVTPCAVYEGVAMSAVLQKRSSRSAARSPHAHPHLTERQQLALALKESADSSPDPHLAKRLPAGFLRIWMVIAIFLVAGTALPVTYHSQRYGFSPLQAALAFFLILNVLICFWEISLGLHIMCVKNNSFKKPTLLISQESSDLVPVLVLVCACFHSLTLLSIQSHS
jgi:hypothetical protein